MQLDSYKHKQLDIFIRFPILPSIIMNIFFLMLSKLCKDIAGSETIKIIRKQVSC